MKIVQDAEIKNKKVFLRTDYNVPLKDGVITDDNRIVASLPTIKLLLENEAAKISIVSHLGKPDGVKNNEFSLLPVANRLAELLNESKRFESPADQYEISDSIVLLENIRFDAAEEKDDPDFAKKLAAMADIYVNDAFAVSHRANASVHAITAFLPSYAGLLVQKEVENLSKIAENPEKPFVLVIGGVKVKDKAGMIDKLAPKADKILVGGGVANTFVKARGNEIGKSVYDEGMVNECKEMLSKYGDKIVLPVDFVTVDDSNLDIGPETIKLFGEEISQAKTVLWNGNLGYTEDPKYRVGSRAVAEAMDQVDGMTVIAGGDTVGFVKEEKLDKNISFISTGGGAALEFLAGEKLPGIEALA